MIHGLGAVRPTHKKSDFIESLSLALTEGTGFAAAKLGISEAIYLSNSRISPQLENTEQKIAFDLVTKVHAGRQSGIFPATTEFIHSFAQFSLESLQYIDYLAVSGVSFEQLLLCEQQSETRFVAIHDLEPDRSIPYQAINCWLPSLRGKPVLIISSIATLLVERAEQELFENVWRKPGIPWFGPLSFEALDFPQIYDQETQVLYPTLMDLLNTILDQIDSIEFDVALIAGASLGIPIAAHVKKTGRVAISLGGHLQVLFGVQGKRWLDNDQWQKSYVTAGWIPTPEWAKPTTTIGLADDGAYW